MHASVGAEKLGGGSCPNRGPTAVSSSTLSLCLAMVSSHAGLRCLPSQSLAQNRQYGDTVTCLQQTPNKNCHSCESPNNLYHKWQYRVTAPTNTPTGIKKQSRTPNEPTMHDNDKSCYAFLTACLYPNSCATNDDRQMRMTDKDTPQVMFVGTHQQKKQKNIEYK